jgi:alpha-L-fucosidase
MYAANQTSGASATSAIMRGKDARFSASALLDNNRSTYWCGDDKDLTPTAEINLGKDCTFNVLHIREFTQLGQRVKGFALDAWINGEWSEVATATTIGFQRLLRLPAVTTQKVRLRITGSLAAPCISEFQLYMEPDGARGPEASTVLKKNAGWKITGSSNNGQGSSADAAIDGNPATLWQTHPGSGELNPPQWFTVDTGKLRKAKGFFYIPRQDKCLHGMTDRYRFEVSADGKSWTQVTEGEFGNLRANPQQQSVTFAAPVELRHFRFTGLRALEKNHITTAEVGLIE